MLSRQHGAESQTIEAVLRAKGSPTQYKHGVSNEVLGECVSELLQNIITKERQEPF